jgi:hypothetical protein
MAVQTVTVTVNGTPVVLTYNGGSGKWEGTVTAPTKSTNRMKSDTITGSVSGADVNLTLTASSDQDKNFATVYKNGVPIADTGWSFTSATVIKVTGDNTTAGWRVEYRLLNPVDGGTGAKLNCVVEAADAAGNVARKSFDEAGGATDTMLTVKETTAPTISSLVPASSAKVNSATPTISGSFSDTDSGVKTSTFSMTITKSDATTLTVTSGNAGLTLTTTGFSYIPQAALPEGTTSYTVTIADNDGNSITSTSTSFTIDTIAPELNVTAPVNNLITNTASLTVTGTTETGAIITITLNGADQGAITNNAGSFSKTITLASGSNTIVVTSKDSANNSTPITRTVTLDTVAPVISAIEITPDPVNTGATLTIKVTVADS